MDSAQVAARRTRRLLNSDPASASSSACRLRNSNRSPHLHVIRRCPPMHRRWHHRLVPTFADS